ncbi:helix-turn-helix transcriptional regulator [Cellulomonas bogoriensis]|uniref:AsnC family transcriptional regulator n=1 Tax=Cellulomonas bogoriensis 69B4 = DSM 16987 TaxID=1386082 RepID=A0A0A0BNC9_9CELL|nr:winged helix-turn-helix domain-containing protein [Cellulomonas bogoriensis]KGM08574.1 AsnC family transcriptional regulator [Cellulomonas bogoriensis 69B4 = DSM 16987]
MAATGSPPSSWTFLTNHGHVLICVATDPDARISDIADRVGIGVRAAQSIVNDLVDAGYVIRTRTGRRNHYTTNPDLHLRHPVEAEHRIGELLSALAGEPATSPR